MISPVGEELRAAGDDGSDRRGYRRRLEQCLEVFEAMLDAATFDAPGPDAPEVGAPESGPPHFDSDRPLTGMEIECNLVDTDYQPVMRNADVLAAIADPAFQTELGAYNIEFNVPPRPLHGTSAAALEAEVRASLNTAEARAAERGSHIVMVGILPTLLPEHLAGPWMSESRRYRALNESIKAARGEDIAIDIVGPERLTLRTPSIAPESACTSTQLHLQVSPDDFAAHWNAAQVIAGPQLALGANSPYCLGHQLWAETRVELFAQATDTRGDKLKSRGVRPRVWFGERWITSVTDLFAENLRYFPPLLAELSDEDPAAEFAAGRTPQLRELRLHNGTVYRWNRPVYDVVERAGVGRPHLRVENRVLPAGPTVLDTVANAAFYYGLVRAMSEDGRPLWTKMSFTAARSNFERAARHGLQARLYWPQLGEVAVDELTLRELLPMAERGLRGWGVDAAVRDRYLGVIEARARTGRNGAVWQVAAVEALQDRGMSRPAALAAMLRRYSELMHSNEPVHSWELPG